VPSWKKGKYGHFLQENEGPQLASIIADFIATNPL
jgi:hypothetical protein